MTENTKQKWNTWYWDVLARPALRRIIALCKSDNRNFGLTENEDDFIEILKYLRNWEKRISLDENTKNDLFIVRNFEGYEELMVAGGASIRIMINQQRPRTFWQGIFYTQPPKKPVKRSFLDDGIIPMISRNF